MQNNTPFESNDDAAKISRFDEEIAQIEEDILGICGGENGSATAMLAVINVVARMARAQGFPMSSLHPMIDGYNPDNRP